MIHNSHIAALLCMFKWRARVSGFVILNWQQLRTHSLPQTLISNDSIIQSFGSRDSLCYHIEWPEMIYDEKKKPFAQRSPSIDLSANHNHLRKSTSTHRMAYI